MESFIAVTLMDITAMKCLSFQFIIPDALQVHVSNTKSHVKQLVQITAKQGNVTV